MKTHCQKASEPDEARRASTRPQAAGQALAASALQQRQRQSIASCFGAMPLQRLPMPGSDATLSGQYTHMMANSATFTDLDRQVCGRNNEYPLTLNDSTLTQAVDYDSGNHAVNVPVNQLGGLAAQPLNVVRANLLWEMHNAANKGPLARALGRQPAPLVGNEKREEKLEHAYRVANLALSIEWLEWSKVLENTFRAQRMQVDLGGAGQIDDFFGASFAVPGQGWYLFSNYLDTQLNGGHTAGYDPAAAAPQWKGHAVLRMALAASKAPMECTEKQATDFRSGAKKSIKSEAANPFRADTHWKEAQRTDY